MEFGKVSPEILSSIHFKLPPEPKVNKDILSGQRVENSKVYVGCAKWGRTDWVGKFYPHGSKEKDFLPLYAQLFNSIELNTTYYRVPTASQIKNWKSKVGKGFKFCPKFTDVITHQKRLKDCERYVDEFLEAILHFEENLGPIFLMPHPQMSPKNFKVIEKFILDFPEDIELFVELRHPDWFVGGLNKDLYELLTSTKRGLIITDAAGRRDCVHMHLTTPSTFIRFVGNALHPTDYERIDDWVSRIRYWLDHGLQTCYIFMHQHDELHSPELAKYLVEKLNKICDLQLKVPEMIQPQNTLF